jgi:hypothetical protein
MEIFWTWLCAITTIHNVYSVLIVFRPNGLRKECYSGAIVLWLLVSSFKHSESQRTNQQKSLERDWLWGHFCDVNNIFWKCRQVGDFQLTAAVHGLHSINVRLDRWVRTAFSVTGIQSDLMRQTMSIDNQEFCQMILLVCDPKGLDTNSTSIWITH